MYFLTEDGLYEEEKGHFNISSLGGNQEMCFLAKDVAEWIEHSNASEMIKKVDEDEKVKHDNIEFGNRTGGNGIWFLTEDGLYKVLMLKKTYSKRI